MRTDNMPAATETVTTVKPRIWSRPVLEVLSADKTAFGSSGLVDGYGRVS
ncbi:hypothetical protein P7L68_04065 (plasmid) [Tistrella mobilis]